MIPEKGIRGTRDAGIGSFEGRAAEKDAEALSGAEAERLPEKAMR